MADDRTIKSTANPWKEVTVLIGGKSHAQTIWSLFGGKDPSQYFAKDLHLFLDGDKGVTFKVSAKYIPVLEQMMKKFKDSTVGKAVGLVQKMADLASGLNLGALAQGVKGQKVAAGKLLSGISSLPANVRYQTKFQNLPAWDSTGPVELGSFVFKFYLGMAGDWDGRTEVYNPALAFMKVNQPSEIKTGILQGPLPNTAWVYGVIGAALGSAITQVVADRGGATLANAAIGALPVKPSELLPDGLTPNPAFQKSQTSSKLQWNPQGKDSKTGHFTGAMEPVTTTADVLDQAKFDAAMAEYNKAINNKSTAAPRIPTDFAGQLTSSIEKDLNVVMSSFENALSTAIDNWPGTGLVQIQIGQFALPKMTVENTSVEFSYDTDNNGYPIWAEVTWSGCKTLEIATIQQMPLHSTPHSTLGDDDTKFNIEMKTSIPQVAAVSSNINQGYSDQATAATTAGLITSQSIADATAAKAAAATAAARVAAANRQPLR